MSRYYNTPFSQNLETRKTYLYIITIYRIRDTIHYKSKNDIWSVPEKKETEFCFENISIFHIQRTTIDYFIFCLFI